MLTILDQIVIKKRQEIAAAKLRTPVSELEILPGFKRNGALLRDYLTNPERSGIIAEFKRQSPSKGIINSHSAVCRVVNDYAANGASAISVLTDSYFFGGSREDLIDARKTTDIPILRKDFMIDEYQLLEAKGWGADIILLIAAILEPKQLRNLATTAQNLGLQVLLEVHTEMELESCFGPNIDAVGVNNRNLADFSVDLNHSFHLAPIIPGQVLKISESGLSDVKTLRELKTAGFNGFLMGENFMSHNDPGNSFAHFTTELQAS